MARLDDPTAIDELAGQLVRQAAGIRDIGGSVERDAHRSSWQSPAATRFRIDATQSASASDVLAAELEHTAAALRREADAVRSELQRLHRLEAAVREHVAAEASSSGQLPVLSIGQFPPPGDTDWDHLARQVGVI